MKKKTLLQLLILIVIIAILIFFYKNSNQNKKANTSIKLNYQSEIINSDNSKLISNLKYVVEGEDGISYTITSEIGELSVEQPNLILMRRTTLSSRGRVKTTGVIVKLLRSRARTFIF